MIETAKKILPRELTTYDVFKCVAVLLMIVDHVGYYFYPEENWWRVAGRLCVPIWFFLVGYARSRGLGPAMWGGAVLLTVGSLAAGMYVFPMNILVTIIAVRLVLDPLMDGALKNKNTFWAVNAVLLAVALPTMMVVEYGTQAVMLAMFGWLTRKLHDGDPRITSELQTQHMAFSIIAFIGYQYVVFGFNQPQALALCVGLLAVNFLLLFFKPGTVPGTGTGAGHILSLPVQLIGRHTLLIYVVHLLIFKALGLLWAPNIYQFMDWQWFI